MYYHVTSFFTNVYSWFLILLKDCLCLVTCGLIKTKSFWYLYAFENEVFTVSELGIKERNFTVPRLHMWERSFYRIRIMQVENENLCIRTLHWVMEGLTVSGPFFWRGYIFLGPNWVLQISFLRLCFSFVQILQQMKNEDQRNLWTVPLFECNKGKKKG